MKTESTMRNASYGGRQLITVITNDRANDDLSIITDAEHYVSIPMEFIPNLVTILQSHYDCFPKERLIGHSL